MSETYRTRPGDTFSSIAKAKTGNDSAASIIAQMNPQVSSPLPPGTSLQLPATGKNTRGFKKFGLDLRVKSKDVGTVDQFTHTAAIDGFRQARFVIPNEVSTRIVCPQLDPVPVDIGYNGFPMMAGYMGSSVPQQGEKRKELNVSALSNPNMLSSNMMVDSFPLEFEKSNLDVITKSLLAPYSIDHEFVGDKGPVFAKIKIKQKQKTLEFLSKLSKQRTLVIGDDGDGRMIYNDGQGYGDPVLVIDNEVRPDVNVVPVYNPNDFFSHVTGILKGKRKRKRKKVTIENPHYRGIIRQHEFEISESDEGELETAVNSVAARMFANVFKLNVTVPGWIDKNGSLLEPGVAISVRSPSDYIREFTTLLVAGVTLRGTPNIKTATLTCVLPGVYAGIIPEVVPWR